MKVTLLLVFIGLSVSVVHCKHYSKCELVNNLKKFGISKAKMPHCKFEQGFVEFT